MYWEDSDSKQEIQVADDIVDILFAIACKKLPVDHAHELSAALQRVLPWIAEDDRVAVHTIHMAGSQNGWERPEHGTERHLILSRRTKLTIRAPKDRVRLLQDELVGRTLDVGGCELTVGKGKVRALSKESTLFARHVVYRASETEELFLDWAVGEIRAKGIKVRKALCGKSIPLTTAQGRVHTRSLLVAELEPAESVRLQQHGVGPHRKMGCGIFIPHKGISAVKKTSGD